MSRGIGQRLDDLQLLDDRAGPPVIDDQRQGVFVIGLDVNEVDVQTVDLGDELRQRVEPGLDLAQTLLLPVGSAAAAALDEKRKSRTTAPLHGRRQ